MPRSKFLRPSRYRPSPAAFDWLKILRMLFALLPLLGIVMAAKEGVRIQNPDSLNTTDYLKWCKEFTGFNIYNIGSKLSFFFTVLIEFTTNRLQKKLTNKVHRETISKMYKVFSAFTEPSDIKEDEHAVTLRRIKIFELVHISLFVLSIFYILICVVSYWISRRTWNKFEKFEHRGEDMVVRENQSLNHEWRRLGWFSKLFSWRLSWQISVSNEEMRYFASRTRFIQLNNLDPKFRFDFYLKHQLQHLFLEMIEINWKIWLGVFGFALINWIRVKYTDNPDTIWGRPRWGFSSWIFIVGLGYGTLAIASFLFVFLKLSFTVYLRRVGSLTSYLGRRGEDLNQKLLVPAITTKEDQKKAGINIRNYFVLRSAFLTFGALQLSVFFQSFYLSMMAIHYSYVIINETSMHGELIVRILILIFAYIPSIAVCIVFFPLSLTPFCILASVENKTSTAGLKAVDKIMSKLKSEDHDHKINNDKGPHEIHVELGSNENHDDDHNQVITSSSSSDDEDEHDEIIAKIKQ